jgi:hypothetical protein
MADDRWLTPDWARPFDAAVVGRRAATHAADTKVTGHAMTHPQVHRWLPIF